MKNYNYKYVVTPNKVIAISTYAGRTVRGVAKCHPNDTFDVEFGKKLAAARCNKKVAYKRMMRALNKYGEAKGNLYTAQQELLRMTSYLHDANEACEDADDVLRELTHDLH